MTQIPVIPQPGDVVVIVPRWIMRALGFLSLFIGLSASFLLFLTGYASEGLIFSVVVLALVPLSMLVQYVLWRFYWYLALVGLLAQFVCFGLTLSGIVNQASLSLSVAESPIGAAFAALATINPLSALLALFFSALITFIFYRVYALWYRPRDQDSIVGDSVSADFGGTTLMDRVVRKLEATGSQAKVEGATVQVYKAGEFVGIVRVIDRQGAITPSNVNDVVKLRDRLGVKIAYIATSGHFEPDVRDLASNQGIRVMTI